MSKIDRGASLMKPTAYVVRIAAEMSFGAPSKEKRSNYDASESVSRFRALLKPSRTYDVPDWANDPLRVAIVATGRVCPDLEQGLREAPTPLIPPLCDYEIYVRCLRYQIPDVLSRSLGMLPAPLFCYALRPSDSHFSPFNFNCIGW
uniref:Uncharacterized protein n=1 Tax=Steinernema glaseri TaxID=37863 RepID=A0A1I8AI61_9BILA